MLFRQLFDQDSSTYSYLLADERTRDALIIDPVFEQFERDATLIDELELKLVGVLDTHVHADHVTGAGLLRQRFGARTVLSERAGAVCADWLVKNGDAIRFGNHALEVRETPGHTSGCLSYVCHESKLAFTGDTLLIRGCGRTDFQQGDAAVLYRSVLEQLFSLPDDTLVYPAHDYKGRTASSIAEEKRLNPRLGGGKSREQFLEIMRGLKLPYPRKMDAALPANIECGLSEQPSLRATSFDGGWAPLALSAAGVPELEARWVAEHAGELLVLDVREPDEYRGELGHVPGADLVPLQTLLARAASLPRDRPIVTVCRSGGRSGQALRTLAERGFARVASLRGGMREWNAQGLPAEFGGAAEHVTNRQG